MNKIYGIPDKDYFFDSWIFIFIALYLFFPVGFILLLRKIHLHRRNLFTSGKIAIGFGIVLILIGFLLVYLISLATNLEAYDIDILFCGVKFFWIIGFIVLIIGILTRLTARRYQKYIKIVVNEGETDLDVIARKMNSSKQTVIKHLTQLISKRYLKNYVIDQNSNKICYFINETTNQITNVQIIQSREDKMQELKEKYSRVVTCKNCGANNLVIDKIGKCSYCNSHIE